MGDAGCVWIGMGGTGGVNGRTVAMLSLGTAMPVGFSYPKAAKPFPQHWRVSQGTGGPAELPHSHHPPATQRNLSRRGDGCGVERNMKEFVEHGGRGERSGRSSDSGWEFADGRRGECHRVRCSGLGVARVWDCVPLGTGLGWEVRGSSRGSVGPSRPQKLGRLGGKVPIGQHGSTNLALGPSPLALGQVEQVHPCGKHWPLLPWGHPWWHGPHSAR